MKYVLTCLLTCWCLLLQAQSDWQETLRQWMTAEDMEEGYGEEEMDLLEEKAQNRINLNQTSREELEQLPFLSAQQVEGLVEYIDRYHPVRTLNELKMVWALDDDTRRLLECFVYVGEEKPKRIWPSMAEIAKDGRHTLMGTVKIPFYERKGDRNGYLGYKYRHNIRYQFNYHNRIKFGITGAQDAGEPFFSNRNKMGYDHYSYYFQLRDMGRLEELNLGMYKVQMGLGLIMNTGFQLGKLASLQSLGRSTHLLTAYSSRSSANYLRGAAGTIRLAKSWRLTLFASYRDIDATLNDDGTARTLVTDGYHRTPTEIAKKNNTQRTDIGGRIGWQRGTLYACVNTVYTHLNRPLHPDKGNTLYRQYAAEGSDFLNTSIDYGYNNHRWSVSGETAINRKGALALLHTVGYQAGEHMSLMVLHRYYDKEYTALNARSFSEGGHVQNEHGIYLGATWKPAWEWTIQGYADYAHFSWPRYRVSTASDAFDALLSARYQRDRYTLNGQYRYHVRQYDSDDKLNLFNRTEHRMRLGGTFQATAQWSLQTQADGVFTRQEGRNACGVMVSGHSSWSWRKLKVDGHVGWFHTDNYDSRLYQYEKSVLYDFSFPMYYGHGLRYSALIEVSVLKCLKVLAKVGVTNYFSRNTIGSGLQQVDRSSLTDLLLQVVCQL